jgi:hypothetical protein
MKTKIALAAIIFIKLSSCINSNDAEKNKVSFIKKLFLINPEGKIYTESCLKKNDDKSKEELIISENKTSLKYSEPCNGASYAIGLTKMENINYLVLRKQHTDIFKKNAGLLVFRITKKNKIQKDDKNLFIVDKERLNSHVKNNFSKIYNQFNGNIPYYIEIGNGKNDYFVTLDPFVAKGPVIARFIKEKNKFVLSFNKD